MRAQRVFGVVLLLVIASMVFSTSCRRALTSEQAEKILRESPLIRAEDTPNVEGISQAKGSNEAIVRAHIGGSTLNLKFRKYDQGWSWEFVETRAGGWIPPEQAIAQIRETNRLQKIKDWVTQYEKDYGETLVVMNGYSKTLPRRPSMQLFKGWTEIRKLTFSMIQSSVKEHGRTEAEGVAAVKELLGNYPEPAGDAWGNEILLNFDDSNRSATFVSIGPDKKKGTNDDVICIAKGVKEWDSEYDTLLWNYPRTWMLPEGLDTVIAPYISKESRGTAEYVRLIEP